MVIRIRRREVIEELVRNKNNFSNLQDFGKVSVSDDVIEKYLSKQFSNLFSSYTQSFNKMYKRMGSLFIKNFRREPILNKEHLINTIIYTHRNPIHHGFCTSYYEWGYTSFNEITKMRSDLIEIEKTLKIFENKNRFIEKHLENPDKFYHTYDLETS